MNHGIHGWHPWIKTLVSCSFCNKIRWCLWMVIPSSVSKMIGFEIKTKPVFDGAKVTFFCFRTRIKRGSV